MVGRSELLDLLARDRAGFREGATAFLAAHDGLSPERRRRLAEGPDALDAPVQGFETLTGERQALVWRVRCLADVPFGITLTGPRYQDNPVRYANETFRELTGYSLGTLRGENLRRLQGPDTEAEAVADLREALDTWEPVTVELTNYRRDGTPFRNRVSLVPHAGADGTVTDWFGVQAAVGEDG